MRRLFKPLLWGLVFLILLLAADQLLIQVPPVHPAHAAVVRFYRDFRARLFGLANAPAPEVPPAPPARKTSKPAAPAPAPQSIEAVIDRQQTAKPVPAAGAAVQRYVYSDDQGQLQFVDRLSDVPAKYRDQAQPMGD